MESYIIFGANSDIANMVITNLANMGHKVYAIARKFDKHNYQGLAIEKIESEFTDFATVDKIIQDISEKDSSIVGIANFAGTIFLKNIANVSEEEYENVMQSNFKTCFAITKSAGKYLKDASVLFISTTATLVGLANHELVAASKAAVNGLIISAAASFAQKNLRFNAIAPSLVETNLAKSIIGNEMGRKFSEGINPLSRIGQIKDIANMANFLLSPDNSWITGQVYAIDGGMSNIKNRLKV